jgi:hypothetical protein
MAKKYWGTAVNGVEFQQNANGMITAGIYPYVVTQKLDNSYIKDFLPAFNATPTVDFNWTLVQGVPKYSSASGTVNCRYNINFPKNGQIDLSQVDFGNGVGISPWGPFWQKIPLALTLAGNSLDVEKITFPSSYSCTGTTSLPYPTAIEWEPVFNTTTNQYDQMRYRAYSTASDYSIDVEFSSDATQKFWFVPNDKFGHSAYTNTDMCQYDLFYKRKLTFINTSPRIDGLDLWINVATGLYPPRVGGPTNPGETGSPPYLFQSKYTRVSAPYKQFSIGLTESPSWDAFYILGSKLSTFAEER